MLKNWIVPTLLLLVSCGGISQAHPLDSHDTVYIDGLPCNTACQSYVTWSRQHTERMTASAQIKRRSSYAIHGVSVMQQDKSERALQARVSSQRVPLPPTKVAELPPVGRAAASAVERADVPTSLSAAGAVATPRSKTIQEQVAAATAFAEQVTNAAAIKTAPQVVDKPNPSEDAEGTLPNDTERSTSAPTKKANGLVALVMARPEIKSVADLAGKEVAVTERQSESADFILTAISAYGPIAVQLSPGHVDPIDRLISGEVPAAILTLASAEAAEWFPDFAGFKIFRVPISLP